MAWNQTQHQVFRKLLRSDATGARVVKALERLHPADAAALFEQLALPDRPAFARALARTRRAMDALLELPGDCLAEALAALDDARVAALVAEGPAEDSATLLAALPEERRAAAQARLAPAMAADVARLLAYPERSAGSVMTPAVFAMPQDACVDDALQELRDQGDALDAFFYVYVVDAEGRLTGVVPLRQLILAPRGTALSALMQRDPMRAHVLDDQEDVAALVSKYGFLSLPVVDDDQRVVGVVTVDDVIDVIHEEATADLYHMAGLDVEERLATPVGRAIRKRLVWTAVNLCTAFFAAWVVTTFEASIDQIVALAVFMPVVAGLGGNSGTQALTVMIRGLAQHELEVGATLRAIGKQLVVGAFVGLAAGALTAGVVYAWRGNPWLGLVLFAAMLANMSVGALVGAATPLVLRALRLDPALGSGILVTAVTDSFGFLSFLGLATLLMAHLA